MQLRDTLNHSPAAAYQTVGEAGSEEAIIINTNTGEYYSLNDTGTRFWELLDGQRSIAECARVIAAEYDAPLREVEADLLELATEFKKEGLIVA
jgi:hypothetical protein